MRPVPSARPHQRAPGPSPRHAPPSLRLFISFNYALTLITPRPLAPPTPLPLSLSPSPGMGGRWACHLKTGFGESSPPNPPIRVLTDCKTNVKLCMLLSSCSPHCAVTRPGGIIVYHCGPPTPLRIEPSLQNLLVSVRTPPAGLHLIKQRVSNFDIENVIWILDGKQE
jgi:hypothetical protein